MSHVPLVSVMLVVIAAACSPQPQMTSAPTPDPAARRALFECAMAAAAQAGFEVRRSSYGSGEFAEGRRLLGVGGPGTQIEVLGLGLASRNDSLVVVASGASGEIIDQAGRYVDRVPTRAVREAADTVMASCPGQPIRPMA